MEVDEDAICPVAPSKAHPSSHEAAIAPSLPTMMPRLHDPLVLVHFGRGWPGAERVVTSHAGQRMAGNAWQHPLLQARWCRTA